MSDPSNKKTNDPFRQHNLVVERTAHYYTLGHDLSSAKFIWFVLHGYGQLASRIIQKFDHLDLTKHYIIAPEGLSRFYWNGLNREVVSSWMTSKDRLDEIKDYLRLLDAVYEIYRSSMPGKKFIVLGFSQGTATAWRWINHSKPPELNALIQWAGGFPPEIDYAEVRHYLQTVRQLFVYGKQDPYFTDEVTQKIRDHIQTWLPAMDLLRFEGKHTIDRDFLTNDVLELV